MVMANEYIDGLMTCDYVTGDLHKLLNADAWSKKGANIGANGDNLTISFLSLNRSALSIKLLQSIANYMPEFAGEVLVIDNGSDSYEIELVESFLAQMPYKWRVIKLGKNYGVAGGRNRTIPYVATEWLMCLDNDIYFISNPLKTICEELAQLGSHFISLPLLNPDQKTIFAHGGHLYLSAEGGELHVGAGSASKQVKAVNKNSFFLSTFLFGGACIFKCETFKKVGGYDEAMFVGFEDIDFSIRLFREGYKVAASSVHALVHDHPLPTTEEDKKYERERFAKGPLKDSAKHMESKYGFKIWGDAVDAWLDTRMRELGLVDKTTEAVTGSTTVHSDNRPGVALVIDTDNWAFGNISRQIVKHLSDKYRFEIIPMDVIDNIDQVFLIAKDCSIVHFFWREHLTLIGSEYFRSYVERLGMSYDDFYSEFIANKIITTSVYDHLLLENDNLKNRLNIFNEVISGYTVGSEKLFNIYANVEGYPKPCSIIEDGVDLELFKPINLERFTHCHDRELVIGWVGNSKWAAEIEDFKGLHTLLKPALEELQAEGYPVRGFFADRQERFIPHKDMPDYYGKIDIYVCSSKIEGTPNPVLESMACGVPIISTDVGIVPQAFGMFQKEFILPERDVPSLKAAIIRLLENRNMLSQLSNENLKQIQDWNWSYKTKKFEAFFENLLQGE